MGSVLHRDRGSDLQSSGGWWGRLHNTVNGLIHSSGHLKMAPRVKFLGKCILTQLKKK